MSLHDALSTLTREGDDFVIDAPAEWSQGRTLYGGITAALAHEAAIRSVEDLPQLRSGQFLFVGPAEGRLTFTVTLLRRGRSTAMIGVDAVSEKGPVLRSSLAFASARESAVDVPPPPLPDVKGYEEAGPLFPGGSERAPGFTGNFDMRLGKGAQGFSGGDAEFWIWARYREEPECHPVSALLAMADVPPPSAIIKFPVMAPLSTLSWQIDLLEQPETVDPWILTHCRAEEASDGYSPQEMQHWDASGRCLALGRQLFAIFA